MVFGFIYICLEEGRTLLRSAALQAPVNKPATPFQVLRLLLRAIYRSSALINLYVIMLTVSCLNSGIPIVLSSPCLLFRLQVITSGSKYRSKVIRQPLHSQVFTNTFFFPAGFMITFNRRDLLLRFVLWWFLPAWGVPHGGFYLNDSGFYHSIKPWLKSWTALPFFIYTVWWWLSFRQYARFHVFMFWEFTALCRNHNIPYVLKPPLVYCYYSDKRVSILTSKFWYEFWDGREPPSALWTFGLLYCSCTDRVFCYNSFKELFWNTMHVFIIGFRLF